MSYNVDPEQLRKFGELIAEVSEKVSGLRDRAESAKLPDGTFTLTSTGRRVDGAHQLAVRRIDAALKTAIKQLDEGAEKMRAAAKKYDEMESDGSQEFDAIHPV